MYEKVLERLDNLKNEVADLHNHAANPRQPDDKPGCSELGEAYGHLDRARFALWRAQNAVFADNAGATSIEVGIGLVAMFIGFIIVLMMFVGATDMTVDPTWALTYGQ